MKYYFLSMILALVFACPIQAQFVDSLAPEIGKLCPDFKLTGVEYYPKTEITRDDLKGKWFVLDLWNRICESCIEKLPEMNRLQQEMGGKAQVILVGRPDSLIRPLYEKLRVYKKLELPITYNELLFQQYAANSLPYLVVVDDRGVVRTVTYRLTKLKLDSMMSGKQTEIEQADSYAQLHRRNIDFDYNKPFLVNGNGGDDSVFLYRSLLSKWVPGMGISMVNLVGSGHWTQLLNNGLQDLGTPVSFLYKTAYHGRIFTEPGDSLYGKIWPFLILHLRDSSLFSFDGRKGINIFNYSLIVPPNKASTEYLMKIMRKELACYFGFRVVQEKKMMPYYKLVARPEAYKKLKSIGASANPDQVMQPIVAGFSFTNVPVSQLIQEIYNLNQKETILDETGIKGNIDIKLEGDMTNLSEIRKVLKKKGLDLLPGKKMMTVTTIYDSVEEKL